MSTDTKKLQDQVKVTLNRISELDDATALKRLHANIHRHPDLEDKDREALDEAVMQRLRVVSPAIATRLGGPKDEQAGNSSKHLIKGLPRNLTCQEINSKTESKLVEI